MTKETNTRSFSSFADLAKAIGTTPADLRREYLDKAVADSFRDETTSDAFHEAFGDVGALSILDIGEGPQELEMPEPADAQAECSAIVTTIFDLFRNTRLEPSAQAIAWGIVNSFHYEAEKLAREEDTLCRDLKDMVGRDDRSEIFATEMDDLQLRAQTKMEQRAAIECMRDYAAECYRAQTGRPWSSARGSKVSSATTASQIASSDFLKARATALREKRNPTGPIVVFSGGQEWHDYQQIYDRLDQIKTRIPHMTLCTTGQRKGCDAIAAAWAAQAGVPLVTFAPQSQRYGKSAGFKRNDQLVNLRPVEAVVCQGTGIQSHLLDQLKQASVPTHAFRYDGQAPAPSETKRTTWA